MMKFAFTNKAKKQLLKLEKSHQARILAKLEFIKKFKRVSASISRLESMEPLTHRLRIGRYRLLMKFTKTGKPQKFTITKIAHRKEIYR